jgi:hypothetical protein
MKEELSKEYRGRVVAIKDGKLPGIYGSEEKVLKHVLEKDRYVLSS